MRTDPWRRFTVLALRLAVSASLFRGASAGAGETDLPAGWRQIEIATGWKIKSFTPRAALDAATLAEAREAKEADGWLAVPTMPAMVHDVLLEHGKIESPWLPGRAEKCRWVAEKDWVYAVRFRATRPDAESWLRFDGLDTIVDAYLDGERIASHWAVNDTPRSVAGTARVQLFHLDRNRVRREIVREVEIGAGRSEVLLRLDRAGIGSFRKEHLLYATLTDRSARVIARAHCLGDIERRVTFPEARLEVRARDGTLLIRSDRYARSVTLEGDAGGDAFGWFFEDNHFDLMPGEERTVRVLGKHRRGRVSARAWHSPHVTTVDWRR